MIRVVFCGDRGKTGSAVVRVLERDENLKIVGRANRSTRLRSVLEAVEADVVVDFTEPGATMEIARTSLEFGARPVVGTTGWDRESLGRLDSECRRLSLGAVVAPNFSIAAVLMMRAAEEFARWLPDAAIVEAHHRSKKDSPSGTASETARRIESYRKQPVPISSIRMEGFVAKQDVIFGGDGERITLSHETLNRECFAPGVRMAVRAVMDLRGLVVGLDALIPEFESIK